MEAGFITTFLSRDVEEHSGEIDSKEEWERMSVSCQTGTRELSAG